MREVIQHAIKEFQSGDSSQKDINDVLNKHFSDKTFQAILQCAQGDLSKCKKVDLNDWKKTAIKDLSDVAQSGGGGKSKK